MMSLISQRTCLWSIPAALRPLIANRSYATQTDSGAIAPRPKRKAVTAFNDDGRVPWGQLSARERLARTTQQSFNFSFIIGGAVLTLGVAYVLYTDVFSPESKTNQFNRAVDQVKRDQRCTDLLGPRKKIIAYGEPTWNKWRRARPISSTVSRDQRGMEHLVMRFNVEGPLNKGVVHLHMIRRPSDSEFAYKYLYLDIQGQQRIYLENAGEAKVGTAKNQMKFFGVSWSR